MSIRYIGWSLGCVVAWAVACSASGSGSDYGHDFELAKASKDGGVKRGNKKDAGTDAGSDSGLDGSVETESGVDAGASDSSATCLADGESDCFQSGCTAQQVCSEVCSTVEQGGRCTLVPPPPDGCMTPCLWEAQGNCLPVLGNCTFEQNPLAPDGYGESCDLQTGWSRVWTPGISQRFSYIYKDGQACWTEQSINAGLAGTFFTNGIDPIAYATLPDSFTHQRRVYCGPYTPWNAPTQDAPYYLETTTPECEAWKSTYLSKTYCRTTTPGDCP